MQGDGKLLVYPILNNLRNNMKLFNSIFILLFLSFSSLFADPAKPQRFSDDPKIIGYLLVKDPSSLYAKIIKAANIVYPSSVASIEQLASSFKNILDQSVTIGAVLYSKDKFEEEPILGVFITAKDKTVFENPFISMMPAHEVIDNTLIICSDPDGMAKIKEFQKKIITLKSQKDVDVFIDLKNIIKLNEEEIKKNIPYAKIIFDQLEMVSINLDLLDTGLDISICLLWYIKETQGNLL